MEQAMQIVTDPYVVSQLVYTKLRVPFENINYLTEITIMQGLVHLKIFIADCDCCVVELNGKEAAASICDQHQPRREQ